MGGRGKHVVLLRPWLVSVRNIAHFDLYFRLIFSRLSETFRLVPCFLIKLSIGGEKKCWKFGKFAKFANFQCFLNFHRLNICLEGVENGSKLGKKMAHFQPHYEFRKVRERAPKVSGGPHIASAILNFQRLKITRKMVKMAGNWARNIQFPVVFRISRTASICAAVEKIAGDSGNSRIFSSFWIPSG